MRRIDRARAQRLRRGQLQLGGGQRADERQAFAEGAARVEIRCERNRGTRVDEGTGGRHRPPEEERARGQEHGGHPGRRQRRYAFGTRGLEVVDRARLELHGELDGALFRELVAVDAKGQARL